MKDKFSRVLCAAALCCAPLVGVAQTAVPSTAPMEQYEEGRNLFRQKAYAAALVPLRAFVKQDTDIVPQSAAERMEAEYMLACAAYELHDPQGTDMLQAFLEAYPDTPHAGRVYALLASARFSEKDHEGALELFGKSSLGQLADGERNEMTYKLALSYLNTGNLQDAAIWLETLRQISPEHAADCTYYLSYIRYTQKRRDEALEGFLSLKDNAKYAPLVPYYMAEIYLQKCQWDKATAVADDYLAAYAGQRHAAEMERVKGTACYHNARYLEAMEAFEAYRKKEDSPRRDALYMEGIACYENQVYTRVPELLERVVERPDTLAQNAYLHMGLAYLHLGDKNQARMAFEQAAASDADRKIKEQAACNYALCLHETSYSAFGESVSVFENFLNEFPGSPYADRISDCLVEVYMNTRSYDAALKSIERISNPGTPILEAKQKILFQLGTQAFANSRFGEAEDYFTRSIALGRYNPQTKADALYWRGESRYRQDKMDGAASDFNAYLSSTPDKNTEMYALAYYNLGYIAFHGKDYASSLDNFRQFTRLERGENHYALADAYNRIGDCYLDNRLFDQAANAYRRAESLQTPAGDYAFYQQALVSGLQKNYDRKVTLLDQLAQKYPDSPYNVNALYEKGRSYVQVGQSGLAIATFSELLQKYPENPLSRKAAAEIGLLYYQSGDYDHAIDSYKHVIEQYPGSEEAKLAMRDLKSVYVDANRVDEIAALAAQMPGGITFEPSEQDSLTYVAAQRIYMKGDMTGAKQSLERYLQAYPGGAFALDAHYYLGVIGKRGNDDNAVLEHMGKLLEYPDNRYSEEALLAHAGVLMKQKNYKDALADYKQLQLKASSTERRQTGISGALDCAVKLGDTGETILAAGQLLAEAKLSPELRNEALYHRAKAYLAQDEPDKASPDLKQLAKDTRNVYGAEARYLIARQLYDGKKYAEAEKEILGFIEQSTPHAYWLARAFILLSDVYVAMDKNFEAKQYLLSLQQNYQADDDIAGMITERLEKLSRKPAKDKSESPQDDKTEPDKAKADTLQPQV